MNNGRAQSRPVKDIIISTPILSTLGRECHATHTQGADFFQLCILLSLCLSLSVSVCLSVCLSLPVSVCLSVSPPPSSPPSPSFLSPPLALSLRGCSLHTLRRCEMGEESMDCVSDHQDLELQCVCQLVAHVNAARDCIATSVRRRQAQVKPRCPNFASQPWRCVVMSVSEMEWKWAFSAQSTTTVISGRRFQEINAKSPTASAGTLGDFETV